MEELVKKIGKKVVWKISGRFIGRSLSLISTFLIIRFLGPTDYGVFSLVSTIIILFQQLTSLNLEGVIPYFFQRFKAQRKSFLKKFLKIRIFLLITGSLSFFFLADLIAGYYNNPDLFFYIKLIAVFAPFFVLMNDSLRIFQGLNNFKKEMQTEIIFHTTKYLAIILIIIGLGISGSIIGYGFSYVITSIFAYYIIFKSVSNGEEFKDNKFWAKYSLIFFLSGFLGFLSQYLIDLFLGQQPIELGYFNSVRNIGLLLSIIPASISSVLLPNITNKSNKEIKELTKIFFNYVFILLTLGLVILLSIPGFITNLLLGKEYSVVMSFFNLLIIGLLFQAINHLYIGVAQGIGKPVKGMTSQLINTVIILFFNFFLINAYNSSIVFLIAKSVSFVFLVFSLRKYVEHPLKNYLKTIISIIPLVLALYLEYNLILKIVFSIMALTLFLIISYYKILSNVDRVLLNKLVQKIIRYIK